MDASNPVISSDRATIASMLERSRGVRRQDLMYLQEVASTSQRVILETHPSIPQTEVVQIMEEFKSSQVRVPQGKETPLDPNVFEIVHERIPVCGILNSDGVPLHPPGVNNSQGMLKVQRQMGGSPGLPFGFADIVEVLGEEVLGRKYIYTAGTWEGFTKRLGEQMGRKTVPILQTMARGFKKLSIQAGIKRLDQLMPRDPLPANQWPGQGEDFYEDLTTKIKITMNSSAGAPYWRNKSQCMEDIVDTGVPVVLKALKTKSLNKLYKENPEMFICEVKNKLDRYESKKLKDKTRPYTCLPAHWALLFSELSQGFQQTLHLFDFDATSSNAYGFSSSNGGLKRMVIWMYEADERGRVACYGDDACIVVKKGKDLYRIDPDFKQMDGSLDAEDIDLTIEWILSHVRRDVGHVDPIWTSIAHVWKKMATNPLFVVDGTRVYKKKSPNGLMTGVPGTTLFDTVKSVLAWNTLLDECAAGVGDILDEKFVTGWMKKQGLIVKEGTWKPSILPKILEDGDLVTDHKFLGVQIKAVDWRGTRQYVPTIPYEDALEMLVTQKDDPFVTTKVSRTMKARTLFDRMRGLMITMAFNHPHIVQAIHNVVNHIPPEVILMQVQNGQGEKPDHITLQDFNYPDSCGFPTVDFCISVYADLEVECEWQLIYPDLQDKLIEFKNSIKGAKAKYKELLKWDGTRGALTVEKVPKEEKPLNEEYRIVTAPEKATLSDDTAVNERSKIFQVHPDKEVLNKYIPSLGETVKRYLQANGGMSPMADVAYDLGYSGVRILREAAEWGYYATGSRDGDMVSLYPLVTPYPTAQEDQYDVMLDKRDLINKSSGERSQGLKASERLIATAPELVLLDMYYLTHLKVSEKKADTAEEALRILNKMLAQSGLTSRWESRVDPKRENSVGMVLWIRHSLDGDPREWKPVAEAWSLSRRLAQDYITKAILEANFVEIEDTKFNTHFVPPPGRDWNNIVEYEENPQKQPIIVSRHQVEGTVDSRMVELVRQKLPYVPEKYIHMMFSIVSSSVKDPEAQILRVVDLLTKADRQVHHWSDGSTTDTSGVGSGPSPSSSDGKSKRKNMTPEARKKQNRKLTERRARQRKLLSALKNF